MQLFTIQYLRGTAATAVVLYHIHIWESKALGGNAVVPRFFAIGDAGVDLFFVISGFIMVFIQPEQIASKLAYGRFLAHRITRVYPPLWIVMSALVPIWLGWPHLFNNYQGNRVDLWRSFLLLPQDYFPLLTVAWTLIHEVYFYVIVSIALCLTLPGRWLFGAVWFSSVFVTFCAFGEGRFNNIRLLQLIFSPYSLTFLLGYFIGLLYPCIQKSCHRASGVFLGLGFIGLVLGYCSLPPMDVYPNNNYLARFMAYGLPSALVVLGCVVLDPACIRKWPIMAGLGDASYAIYLIHVPVIAGFYAVVKRLQPHDCFLTVSLALTCLLLCLTLAVVFHQLIERRVIRIFRELIDRRIHIEGTR